MTITMPDKPGQLNIISNICANSGANVLRVEHNRFTMDLSASLAKLDITIETQNEGHLTKIINLIEKEGLPVTLDDNNWNYWLGLTKLSKDTKLDFILWKISKFLK